MKYITNSIRVFDNFAKEIARGETGILKIAPECNGETLYVYLETNGDPVLVGWVEDDFTYDDGVTAWINDDSFEWLRVALDGYHYPN